IGPAGARFQFQRGRQPPPAPDVAARTGGPRGRIHAHRAHPRPHGRRRYASTRGRGVTMTDTTRRYLALGDSYTIGEGVSADARWPVVVAQRLRDGGLAVDDPEIIAVTGWT